MPQLTSPQMHVVKKEEKESRLKAFILEHVSGGSNGAAPVLSFLARAVDSPVYHAVKALAPDLAAAGIAVRAVIVHEPDDGSLDFVMDGVVHHIRQGRDLRLLDAHEQLVIGSQVAWIGDCMRRDPTKRDAYECYSANSAATATFTLRSFERIWQRSVGIVSPTPVELATGDTLEPSLMVANRDDTAAVSSRH